MRGESKNMLTCLGEMKMQFNAEIVEREKMKAFFRMPDEALYHKIIICTYENVPAVAVVFYKKSTKEPFAFRIAPADYFSAEELIEIFKIFEFRGGEIRDDWYDIFSKWLKQLPFDICFSDNIPAQTDALEAFCDLRNSCKQLPEITLDEINAEISAARAERTKK